MSARQEQQSELLAQYLKKLESDPAAPPPQGLDPEMLETIKKLEARLAPPEPTPEFVASLRARLDREAAAILSAQPTSASLRRFFALPRWSFVGLAAALLVALSALAFFATRPPSVSAQELLDRARSAASDLNSVGVKSFEMVQTSYALIVDDPQTPPTRASHGETKTWYAGPTHWRIETKTEIPAQQSFESLTVSDGTSQWDYNPTDNTVNVQHADIHNFPSPSVLSLDFLQQDMSNCYDPKVVGEETVAGRAAYQVYLGPAKCRSASIWYLNGPHTIWLDKQTFFVLKSEIRAEQGDQISSSLEVTHIAYNRDLSNDLFTFTPPAGARVNDMRPQPAPDAQAFKAQLAALAQRIDFPLFAPQTMPNNLVPLAPKWNEIENQVELGFVPSDQINSNSQPDAYGILVYERRADYELVRNWTDGAEPTTLDGAQAWLRRGDFDPASGTGSNSAVMVLRDGVLLSLSSFRITPEQLLGVAKSLAPIPGGHAPLPNPTAPTLAELRARSDFPYFVPTYVPEGLIPEPPTSYQLQFHRADGTPALIVQNAKQGEGGMEQDARFKGELIKLPNGLDAHELTFEPQISVLWWRQDNGYVSLEGHGIPRSEMLKIAASMSSTAGLGETELPLAQPTPTPVPAPSFTILRPTFLPEKMTVTETNIPTPSQQGSGVELRFDPHPDGTPHDALTLTEIPQSLASASVNDPQSVKQNIGGRDVTVVKRGAGCVTYQWLQAGLSLTLTNLYDPPGEPGQVRYPCDIMEQIIASIPP